MKYRRQLREWRENLDTATHLSADRRFATLLKELYVELEYQEEQERKIAQESEAINN